MHTKGHSHNGRDPQPKSPIWPALLALTLLTLPAIQPLAGRALTCGYDAVFHLWRAVQMEALLSEGVWFSRWAPHMAHGYGYPLYLFQSPLSAYAAAWVHMGGASWPVAINSVFGLGMVLSGWGMWLLARDLWGERGALVAAVAYLYAPFHAYVAYFRASLSETAAWALVPLVCWGLRRWQVRRQRRGLATAVLAFIALVWTHDVTMYAFFPFFMAWMGIIAASDRSWRRLWRGLAALALGIGGSAFFWLPALAERRFIQFERANSAWPFLYNHNFLPLDQLLPWPRNADPSLLNDWPQRGLGVVLAGLAVAGAVVAWRRQPARRWLSGYLMSALAGYVLLTIAASRPLWDTISLLQAFQFPWRFLAPATFVAALLAGGLLARAEVPAAAAESRRRAWGLLACIGLVAIAHWGWFYPEQCAAPADTSLAGMVAWEEATRTLGTTASRELLPVTVSRLPQEVSAAPAWESRFMDADLPAGGTIYRQAHAPLRTEIELETAVPFTARFRTFYFPGWQAWVDGKKVDITITEPEGLLAVPVPAGQRTVTISFGETPLRMAANLISLASLGGFMLVLWRQRGEPDGARQPSGSRWHRWPLLLGLAVVMLAGKQLIDRQASIWPRQAQWQGGAVEGVAHPYSLNVGTPAAPAQVRFLGHEAWSAAAAADQPLDLALYWAALTPLDREYRVGLSLVDENGHRWSAVGLRDYRWGRAAPGTTGWSTDHYVKTAFHLDLLPGTPPGTYQLQLSFFAPGTFTPLTFYPPGETPTPALTLGTVTVLPPTRPWRVESLAMPYRLNLYAGAVAVLGSHIDRETAAAGELVTVTLFWQNESDQPASGQLALVAPDGQTIPLSEVSLPAHGEGLWRSQHTVRLPAALGAGDYRFQLTVGETFTPTWGPVTVTTPTRTYAPPDMVTAVKAAFGQPNPLITLVGFTLQPDNCLQANKACEVALSWQAERDMPTDYRLFVQLLAADDTVIAQSDGVPAHWTRPTTGWLPGEFVRDNHTLSLPDVLPSGEYRLIVGWYEAQSGTRLTLDDGSNFAVLATFTLR